MDLDTIRNDLVSEKARLARRLCDIGVAAGGGSTDVGADEGFADSGSVIAEKRELMSLADELADRLLEVDHALAKFDNGTYGCCERCGKPIEEARLDLLPSARLCKTCAAAE